MWNRSRTLQVVHPDQFSFARRLQWRPTLPLDERIRRRAYELYVDRGNQSGSELDDRLQAEEEILQGQEEGLGES